MTKYLAALGDANDPNAWSGIPFRLLQAGREGGLFDTGLALETNRWDVKLGRNVWNMWQLMTHGSYGGFQFTEAFPPLMWKAAPKILPGDLILNCYHLFPKALRENRAVRKWLYIDMTFDLLFNYYGCNEAIAKHVMEQAYVLEQLNYDAAEGIIMYSHWAADNLRKLPGVDPNKISVVYPGANLDESIVNEWEKDEKRADARDPSVLRLIFVGKYWLRKGLDRLLNAFALARSEHQAIELWILGYPQHEAPKEFAEMAGVRWLGFINKKYEARRFVDIVGSCDVGCLLSRAEAGGNVLREFHRLGLATLVPDTGGAPEHSLSGARTLISPDASAEDIAKAILQLARDRALLDEQRKYAWDHRHEMRWSHTVEQIKGLVDGKGHGRLRAPEQTRSPLSERAG